jgi:hypothetical protein
MLMKDGHPWNLKMQGKVDVCLNDLTMVADVSASCREGVKVFCLWVCNGQMDSSAYWHQNCKRWVSMIKVEIK